MNVGQTAFTQAILDPDMAVPEGLIDPQGRPAGKRFAVYRNNVAVSLTDALKAAFPVVLKLVGDEFFSAMAGVYLRRFPPNSALMMHYGTEMPSFLADFEPVSHLGYLPDIAHLELALRQSYHAADTSPIDPADLQNLAPEALTNSRLRLAPSVQLLKSQWPIHSIWLFNTQDGAPAPKMIAQDVLITRVEFDPFPHALPAGGGAFTNALLQGKSFGDALGVTGDDFDLTTMLGILLSGNAITSIIPEGKQ